MLRCVHRCGSEYFIHLVVQCGVYLESMYSTHLVYRQLKCISRLKLRNDVFVLMGVPKHYDVHQSNHESDRRSVSKLIITHGSEFKYPGTLITSKHNRSTENRYRLQVANRCSLGLKKQVKSHYTRINTNLTLYKTYDVIRRALIYGCKT
jgi:hypothetical protein